MLNTALAHAIVDSQKKKKTIARLARVRLDVLSGILHCKRKPSEKQRVRIARVLGRPVHELFPESVSAPASEVVAL